MVKKVMIFSIGLTFCLGANAVQVTAHSKALLDWAGIAAPIYTFNGQSCRTALNPRHWYRHGTRGFEGLVRGSQTRCIFVIKTSYEIKPAVERPLVDSFWAQLIVEPDLDPKSGKSITYCGPYGGDISAVNGTKELGFHVAHREMEYHTRYGTDIQIVDEDSKVTTTFLLNSGTSVLVNKYYTPKKNNIPLPAFNNSMEFFFSEEEINSGSLQTLRSVKGRLQNTNSEIQCDFDQGV